MYTGVIIIYCAIFYCAIFKHQHMSHRHRKLFCGQLTILSIILHQCSKFHFLPNFRFIWSRTSGRRTSKCKYVNSFSVSNRRYYRKLSCKWVQGKTLIAKSGLVVFRSCSETPFLHLEMLHLKFNSSNMKWTAGTASFNFPCRHQRVMLTQRNQRNFQFFETYNDCTHFAGLSSKLKTSKMPSISQKNNVPTKTIGSFHVWYMDCSSASTIGVWDPKRKWETPFFFDNDSACHPELLNISKAVC